MTNGRCKVRGSEVVLVAENEVDVFVLSGVEHAPIPSFLRDFSSPVNMVVEGQTVEDLNMLLANDSDGFNRCSLTAPPSSVQLSLRMHQCFCFSRNLLAHHLF